MADKVLSGKRRVEQNRESNLWALEANAIVDRRIRSASSIYVFVFISSFSKAELLTEVSELKTWGRIKKKKKKEGPNKRVGKRTIGKDEPVKEGTKNISIPFHFVLHLHFSPSLSLLFSNFLSQLFLYWVGFNQGMKHGKNYIEKTE